MAAHLAALPGVFFGPQNRARRWRCLQNRNAIDNAFQMTGVNRKRGSLGTENAAAAARTAILRAARARFAHENYDRVQLHDIADDAHLPSARIEAYFASKEDLLAEVLADAIYPSVLMDGDRATFGARLMAALVEGKPHDAELDYFLLLLRVATVPALQGTLHNLVQHRLLVPFAAWIGGVDAPLRARLVHTLLTGASMQMMLSGDVPMAPKERDRFRDVLARLIQGLVDGKNSGTELALIRPARSIPGAAVEAVQDTPSAAGARSVRKTVPRTSSRMAKRRGALPD